MTQTWFVGTLAVALLTAMLHLFSPGSTGADSAHDRTSAPPVESPKPQPVVRGDTLWDIAKKYVGDPSRYPELTEPSNIRNPDLIHPSDIVRIEIRENRK